MPNSIDLREIEQRTYLAYHQDGLADIAAGFFITGFGLDMALNSSIFLMISWLPILLVLPLKKLITYPRIGYIKFAPERRRKISKGILAMVMVLVLSAGLAMIALLAVSGELAGLKAWFDRYPMLLLVAIIAGGLALAALMFQIARFYLYAIIEFGAWLLSDLLGIDPGIPVVITGAIMLLVGIGLFIRFLIENPRLSE
jgi:hypothetical protein